LITVITCNYNKSRIEPLKKNIGLKIGIEEYEVIFIDNSLNSKSIFEAYNEGAKQAKFDNLLFIHDDIEIHTNNFGRVLLEMNLPNLGVLGIAGSNYKSKIPSPWWVSNFHQLPDGILFQYNIQHFKYCAPELVSTGFSFEQAIQEVLFIDGVFMFTKKDNWLKYPFDDINFNSFHFYDLDFSLGMRQLGKTNYVTNSILVEHFSSGSLNRDWIKSSSIFSNKWPMQMNICSLMSSQKILLENLAIESRFRILLDNDLKYDSLKLLFKNWYFKWDLVKFWIKNI
jgi:GT2 family glycosyltransferase